ncbi:TatD family hydrolase, partial [bacterium]|nr:TatD family hydrolase [bacterium]
QEMIEFLKQKTINNKQKIKGVIHCFTGNWEQAKEYLSMGFFLGFNGIIFKLNLDEIIQKTPLDKILVETDCPYLSPPGYKERNDPLGLELIIEKIANIKSLKFQEVQKQTTENALNLFLTTTKN